MARRGLLIPLIFAGAKIIELLILTGVVPANSLVIILVLGVSKTLEILILIEGNVKVYVESKRKPE